MSAIAESSDAHEPIKVLFTLHDKMDAMDFVGPLEVLTHAQHNINDSGMRIPSSVLLAHTMRQSSLRYSLSTSPLTLSC